ncbi:MAG: DegQ family serine endoprotease [Rhodospirillales bacterium]
MNAIRTRANSVPGRLLAPVHVTWLVIAALLLSATSAYARSTPESFADLAEDLLPKVVNISTTTVVHGREGPAFPQLPPGSPFEDFFEEFFNRQQPQQRERNATSLGSGFLISKDGYVVTNNHVIQDADEITVILHDDTRLKAVLVGRDSRTDIAVLKVDPDKDLPYVKFGDSDASRVGDWIVAIGNPFGLGGTVTAGIISARGRDINSGPYDDYIQTDASINRGNSGGPMFNIDGEVIGINTAIFSPSGGSVGIGFAIPTSTAKPVIDQLIDHGEVRRGWLGVHIQQVSEDIAETLGLEDARGALIANIVADGPAADSDLKVGDVILEFDGKPIDEMRELPRVVAETAVGKEVTVSVWRDGERAKATVTLGELPDEEQLASADVGGNGQSGEVELSDIGLTASPLNDEIKSLFELDENAKGVIVTAVDEGGPAAEKGIMPGDLIVEVSRSEVSTPTDIQQKIDAAREAGRKVVLMLVESQAGPRFVTVSISQQPE